MFFIRWLRVCVVAIFAITSVIVAGCGPSAAGSGKPIVVSTIFAYYDAARAVGGDKVDVRILLPPRMSPHDYDPSPEARLNASKAKLFIYNGMALDDHLAELAKGTPAHLLNVSKALGFKTDGDSHADHHAGSQPATTTSNAHAGHDHEGNPHIWLDVGNQVKAAEHIRDELAELLPQHAAAFQDNCRKYTGELMALDQEFAAATKELKRKEFIGFHEAYDFLAERYGLTQIESVEAIPGSANPEQIMKVIQLIKQKNLKYIAVESALQEQGVKRIQEETGVKVVTLQPLETYDRDGDTYVELMRKNLAALKLLLAE